MTIKPLNIEQVINKGNTVCVRGRYTDEKPQQTALYFDRDTFLGFFEDWQKAGCSRPVFYDTETNAIGFEGGHA